MAAPAETAAKYSRSAPGPVSRGTGPAPGLPGPAAASTRATRNDAVTPGQALVGTTEPLEGRIVRGQTGLRERTDISDTVFRRSFEDDWICRVILSAPDPRSASGCVPHGGTHLKSARPFQQQGAQCR